MSDLEQPHLPGIPAEAQEYVDHLHSKERGIFEHSLEKEGVAWDEKYKYLLGRGFYWRKAAVIAWLLLPKGERIPETKGELAKMLGLSNTSVIARYEQSADVQATLLAMNHAALLNHLASVDHALVEAASSPDYKNNQDRKTYYQRLGLLKEKHEVNLGEQKTTEMTEAELLRLAQMGEYDDSN